MAHIVARQNKMESRGTVFRFLAEATHLSHLGFVRTGPAAHPGSHASGKGVKIARA